MTPVQIQSMANALRSKLQDVTCCQDHAIEVLYLVLVSFSLDQNADNDVVAAAAIRLRTEEWAVRIEKGHFAVTRGTKQ